MLKKIRPIAKYQYDFGNDGRDGKYFIAYYCPVCHERIIRGYNSDTACRTCDTFFDWGERPPEIKTVTTLVWDE